MLTFSLFVSVMVWLLLIYAVVSLTRRFVPYGDVVIAVVVTGVLLKWFGVI